MSWMLNLCLCASKHCIFGCSTNNIPWQCFNQRGCNWTYEYDLWFNVSVFLNYYFGFVFNWPRGPMDKASAYGAGDCRFESCRGHFHIAWDCINCILVPFVFQIDFHTHCQCSIASLMVQFFNMGMHYNALWLKFYRIYIARIVFFRIAVFGISAEL